MISYFTTINLLPTLPARGRARSSLGKLMAVKYHLFQPYKMSHLSLISCFFQLQLCLICMTSSSHLLSYELCTFSSLGRILSLSLSMTCVQVLMMIMDKTKAKGTKRAQYGGAAGTRLSHLRGWKSEFFQLLKINIQDNDFVAIDETNSMSPRTPKNGVRMKKWQPKY